MYYDGPIDYHDSELGRRVIVRSWSFGVDVTLAAIVFPGARHFCRVMVADEIHEFCGFRQAWRFFVARAKQRRNENG